MQLTTWRPRIVQDLSFTGKRVGERERLNKDSRPGGESMAVLNADSANVETDRSGHVPIAGGRLLEVTALSDPDAVWACQWAFSSKKTPL